MSTFTIGDRVRSMDSDNAGEVTSGFFYRDVSGTPPRHGQVPVDWDNGTRSYIEPSVLSYEEVAYHG